MGGRGSLQAPPAQFITCIMFMTQVYNRNTVYNIVEGLFVNTSGRSTTRGWRLWKDMMVVALHCMLYMCRYTVDIQAADTDRNQLVRLASLMLHSNII